MADQDMYDEPREQDMTLGQKTSQVVNNSVSFLETMWNRHATLIVIVILLVILFVWYRKETTAAVGSVGTAIGTAVGATTSAVGSVGSAVGTAVGSVGSAVGSVGNAISATSSEFFGSNAKTIPSQVGPNDLAGLSAPLPTASEIKSLFNF